MFSAKRIPEAELREVLQHKADSSPAMTVPVPGKRRRITPTLILLLSSSGIAIAARVPELVVSIVGSEISHLLHKADVDSTTIKNAVEIAVRTALDSVSAKREAAPPAAVIELKPQTPVKRGFVKTESDYTDEQPYYSQVSVGYWPLQSGSSNEPNMTLNEVEEIKHESLPVVSREDRSWITERSWSRLTTDPVFYAEYMDSVHAKRRRQGGM